MKTESTCHHCGIVRLNLNEGVCADCRKNMRLSMRPLLENPILRELMRSITSGKRKD
jgi:hypothetical protein